MPNKLSKIIKDIEDETGTQYSTRERTFALAVVSGENRADAARKAGVPDGSASQRGYEMGNDPEIQRLIDEVSKFKTDQIDDNWIKSGLLKEAVQADTSRDRREALHLLGKTKGLFKDVIEQTTHDVTDDELIERIRSEFGNEAADKAIIELGDRRA